MRKIDPTILREYDIRGIVDKDLFKEDALILGKAIGTRSSKSKHKQVIIGYDGRHTSPEMRHFLLEGLISTGIKIIDIGLVPTPLLYYAANTIPNDYAIVITASHNPSEYNGFKITKAAKSFFGNDIKILANEAMIGDFAKGVGSIESININEKYIDRLTENISINPNLKVIWDPANGAAAELCGQLVKRLDGTHIVINDVIDGSFPNHFPDPTIEKNLEQLKAKLKSENADLGIAFDGDADRIGVIDRLGRVIWGDQLLTFFAKELISRKPNSTIIADVKASNVFVEKVTEYGGKPIIWKTGHSLIKSKMQEEDALIAGEMSGHIFFKDKYYGFDDALYAGVRLLDIISRQNIKLDEYLDSLPETFASNEIKIPCEESQKFKIVEAIQNSLRSENIDFNDIDGVRFTSDIGWWLIRASNTSAVIVVRCEAKSIENLEKLKDEINFYLKPHKLTLPIE
jgi:phosphomannomutase